MGRGKVTVVGAGNVGATTAQRLVERGYADVVLLDIVEGRAQGKALDLAEAMPLVGPGSRVIATSGYAATAGSDVVVISSGVPRRAGMSLDDLLETNAGVVREVTEKVKVTSPGAVIIVVANPLSAMVTLAHHVSGFPRERVLGMAGVLDSARYRAFIAEELGVSVEDVHGFVLGGRGDAMVALPRYTSVGGVPLPQLLSTERIDAIVARTRRGGQEVLELLRSGTAFYAPAAAIEATVEAVLLDRKRVMPCAVRLEGEYGISDVFLGVLTVLGAGGMERIVEVSLTAEELAAMERSAEVVRQTWAATRALMA
ncbi:MAG TPA: malate dehydrogenase [Candidatus Dormibacteraeota bacterium]|jgi:malate dehydrogenase|nr:malate dehydrogenase [Candidatus Dormibacteraeota bacterium]